MADWQQRRRVSLKLGVSVIKISTHVIMRIYASDALQYLGMPNLSAGLALAPAQRVSFFVPGHLTATACWCAPPMATAPSPPLPMESSEKYSLENCLRMRPRLKIRYSNIFIFNHWLIMKFWSLMFTRSWSCELLLWRWLFKINFRPNTASKWIATVRNQLEWNGKWVSSVWKGNGNFWHLTDLTF